MDFFRSQERKWKCSHCMDFLYTDRTTWMESAKDLAEVITGQGISKGEGAPWQCTYSSDNEH